MPEIRPPITIGAPAGAFTLAGPTQDILPGDELIAIDGLPVRAESETDLETTLSGGRNSGVRLVFGRERSNGTIVQLPRTVKRNKLDDATAVPVAFMLAPGTGYLRLTPFNNEKVADNVRDTLGTLQKQGMKDRRAPRANARSIAC